MSARTETRDSRRHEFKTETQTTDGRRTTLIIPQKDKLKKHGQIEGRTVRSPLGWPHLAAETSADERKRRRRKLRTGARERDPPLPSVRLHERERLAEVLTIFLSWDGGLTGEIPIRPTPSQTGKETTEKTNRSGHGKASHLASFPFPSLPFPVSSSNGLVGRGSCASRSNS